MVVGATAVLTGAAQDDRRHAVSTRPENTGAGGDRDRRELDDRSTALSRDAERVRLRDAQSTRLQALARQDSRIRAATLREEARLALERGQELRRRTSWALPLAGFRITSTFGLAGSLWSSGHTGLDLAAPEGTPIRAVAAGTVKEAGWSGAYGNRTIVRTADGTEIWYCHQSRVDVASGDQVTSGELVGAVGSTGNVTGPHLHLEVRPGGGDPVDPEAVLKERGLTF